MTDYPNAVALLYEIATEGDPYTAAQRFDRWAYVSGGCALYAAALINRHPDWGIVSVGFDECTEDRDGDLVPCGDYGHNVCGCKIHHFFAIDNDGFLHDVTGRQDVEELEQHTAVWSINDDTLTNVMDSWYNQTGDDADLAAWAIALTAR